MAKAYSFVDIPKISSPTATPIAGGNLAAGVTYYYRVYKCYQPNNGGYAYGKSIISDEFSATTDATNKTIRIQFSSPNISGGYIIYRFTTPGVMNVYTNCLTVNVNDSTHNSGGTVTFDDTGYAANTGNVYLEDRDNAHGRLTISGSTSSDKFSIVDLYNADVANGWGVIQKLDENTYKVNTYLLSGSTEYWDDIEKTIVFADGLTGGGTWYFGRVSGTNRTYAGCNIIIKSTWLVSVAFTTLIAYRTSFQYVYPKNGYNDIHTGLGLCHISFSGNSIVQDVTCDRSRSFAPSNTSIVKNVIVSRFDVAFGASAATFDDVKCLSGSRVWQFGGNTTKVTARGVYTEGTYAILVINGKTGSSLTLIDSQIQAGTEMFGSYIDNDGFQYFDKFSYNLKVLEQDEITPIANATITMYDNSGQAFQVLTDSNGDIAEQYILKTYGTVDTPVLPSVYTFTNKYPYKLVIEKDGYETYIENFTQTVSNPIVKIVALKKAQPIRLLTDGAVLALTPETGSSSLLKRL